MFKMKKYFVSAFIVSILVLVASFSGCELINGGGNDNNGYPVVLLHGFLGWGRDELGGKQGHFHMGGYHDMQELIKASGSDCYTAVVGPFSSNWDRTCELYAQLKGTRTDYGLIHSRKHGHARFAKEGSRFDFRGRPHFQGWGEPGKNRKIHLIGHSYGGQTVRTLAQLLANGSDGSPDDENDDVAKEEYRKNTDTSKEEFGSVSPLFDGTENKDMIHSITTVSATHNGTTLSNFIDGINGNGLINVVAVLISAIGTIENELYLTVYDFKLQQFGIFSDRIAGEDFGRYFARMKKLLDNLVKTKKDHVVWDIAPEGARDINRWVHAQSNIYYFSYATSVTLKAALPNPLNNWEHDQLPYLNAHWISQFEMAYVMGRYTCNNSKYRLSPYNAKGYFYDMSIADRPNIDSKWWPNDGTVNTISMKGPWLYPVNYSGIKDSIVVWDKDNAIDNGIVPEKGVWNYGHNGKPYADVDHWDGQGLEIFKYDTNNYNNPEFTGPSLNDLPNIDSNNWANPEAWYVDWTKYLKTL